MLCKNKPDISLNDINLSVLNYSKHSAFLHIQRFILVLCIYALRSAVSGTLSGDSGNLDKVLNNFVKGGATAAARSPHSSSLFIFLRSVSVGNPGYLPTLCLYIFMGICC